MLKQLADRSLLWSKREGQLFRGKSCDGFDEGVLIVLPTWFVKRGEGSDWFCHSYLLLASETVLPPLGTSVKIPTHMRG
jgi:hypothetical protein